MKQPTPSLLGMSVAMTVAALSLGACSAGAPAPSASPAASASTDVAGESTTTTSGAAGTTTGTVVSSVAGADLTAACSIVRGWNTAPDDGGLALSPGELSEVRAGRHSCYDRVVFDVDGPDPVGFVVRYVPVVTADGSGEAVPVPGSAALEVIVRAPYAGTSDPQAWPDMPRVGDELVPSTDVSGWRALRSVAFAGSFEGQSTIAVGVREKSSFRAWVSESAGGQKVVLDIAH